MPTEHTCKVWAKPTPYALKPGPKGVNGEAESEVDEDKVEECPKPQMSRLEMAKLSKTLRIFIFEIHLYSGLTGHGPRLVVA